jgi:hypothetical protein
MSSNLRPLAALAMVALISAGIASHESFSGWTKTFTDPSLCAAIVDRLTFDGTR